MNTSLLIGVEEYADPQIRAVPFAGADARGLAAALAQLGIGEAKRDLLVDAQATKTIVESRVRQAIRSLSADDTLYLYYAGHGYSKDGRGFLTCHDTQLADLEATSIALDWLLG
ncbi:MAG: caspase family protein, partial [Pirellulaceae bacterium]